jgi:hypothetical protein
VTWSRLAVCKNEKNETQKRPDRVSFASWALRVHAERA